MIVTSSIMARLPAVWLNLMRISPLMFMLYEYLLYVVVARVAVPAVDHVAPLSVEY